MILRDKTSNIIFSSCKELFFPVEMQWKPSSFCMEGLSLSLQRSVLPILLEVVVPVVNILKDEVVDRSLLASLVAEIKYLFSLRKTCITQIKRSQNVVGDFLVNFARTENRAVVWLGSGPPDVVENAPLVSWFCPCANNLDTKFWTLKSSSTWFSVHIYSIAKCGRRLP